MTSIFAKTFILTGSIIALGSNDPSQAAVPPTSGSQMQQIPPAPAQRKTEPKIDIRDNTKRLDDYTDKATAQIKKITILGSTIFQASTLLAATNFKSDSLLSLTDLRHIAREIENYYHKNGYFAAQTYLPAQEINNGDVRIVVLEGRYGKISLNNHSRLSTNLARDFIKPIHQGDAISTPSLERSLLLLSDVPGIDVHSTLTPGASIGASDLIVDVAPGPLLSGSVDGDNGGNRYTGAYRAGGTLNANGLVGYGDVLTLRVLSSGAGLKYGRIAYQAQAGQGKVGIAYSILDYQLGKEFSGLLAHGTAQIASIYTSYPLIRSRRNNLYGQIAFDRKRFKDQLDSLSSSTGKSSDVLMLSLKGDSIDRFGGGGRNSFYVTFTDGRLGLGDPAELATDAITAKTNGHFSKIGFSASRSQNIDNVTTAFAAINGQLAWNNLDVSEKIELGGASGVRAYPEGEAYGDRGFVLNLEVRRQLPKLPALPGIFQLVGFFDVGTVAFNAKPWTIGTNHKTLAGAGVGLNWAGPGNLAVRVNYARRIGETMATSAPDKSGRFWMQLIKYF